MTNLNMASQDSGAASGANSLFDLSKLDLILDKGYTKTQALEWLEKNDKSIDFNAFRKNYGQEDDLIFDELKRGNKTGEIDEYNSAMSWTPKENRVSRKEWNARQAAYKQKEFEEKKAEHLNALENESTLAKVERKAGELLTDNIVGDALKWGVDYAAETLGFKKPFNEKEKEQIEQGIEQDIKKHIATGKGFEELSAGQRAYLAEKTAQKMQDENLILGTLANTARSKDLNAKTAFNTLQQEQELANKDEWDEKDYERAEDYIGFWTNLFNDKEETKQEFKEKKKAENIISKDIQKAVNTLKQFDRSSLLISHVASAEEKEKMRDNLLKEAFKIADLTGFDDVGMDEKNDIYFIKNDEEGKPQSYLVNTGMIDNFWDTLINSKYEVAGGLAGFWAGAQKGLKKGKTLQSKAGNVVGYGMLGALGGAAMDDIMANIYLNREQDFKKTLDYAVQQGLLSAAGDGLIMGASKLASNAKPIITKTFKGINNTADKIPGVAFAKNLTIDFARNLPNQNIRAASNLAKELYSEKEIAALNEAKELYGGALKAGELDNKALKKLGDTLEKKLGKNSFITQQARKFESAMNANSLKQKQQEFLEFARSDKDGNMLAYLIDVTKDDAKLQKNLTNMMNLATFNVEKNLKNLNLNPAEIKLALDEFEKGTKEAYKAAEKLISGHYDDNFKVILNKDNFNAFLEDLSEKGVIFPQMKGMLEDLSKNVFNENGVTFTQLHNARMAINNHYKNINNQDASFFNGTRKHILNELKAEIDRGIDNILKQDDKAYTQFKELFETSLQDYSLMQTLKKDLKDLKLQDKNTQIDKVVDNLIKFSKGQGEKGVNNLEPLKKYLGKDNEAFLEMQILKRLYEKSLVENDELGARIFDSTAFFNKLSELSGEAFKSKQAQDFIDIAKGFDALYKNDAKIIQALKPNAAKEHNSFIATSAEGAFKQILTRAQMNFIFRNLGENFFFSFFKKGIQGGAMRYHLKKALERSLNYEDFKLKLEQQISRAGFNSESKAVMDELLKDIDTLNAQKKAIIKEQLAAQRAAQEQEALKAENVENLENVENSKTAPSVKAEAAPNLRDEAQSVDESLNQVKQKTIKSVDLYTKSPEFKNLDKEKQEAILSLKNIEPEKMPDDLNLNDFSKLSKHFSGKMDENQRNMYLKLLDSTKNKPDIELEVLKNNEVRTEFIKAFQHKNNKDLFYIAVTKDDEDITAFPTTQINKIIKDIAQSQRVIKRAGDFKAINDPAEPINEYPKALTLNENSTQNLTNSQASRQMATQEQFTSQGNIVDTQSDKEFLTQLNDLKNLDLNSEVAGKKLEAKQAKINEYITKIENIEPINAEQAAFKAKILYNLNALKNAKNSGQIQRYTTQLEKDFNNLGYELVNYEKGAKFNDGMNVNVLETQGKALNDNEQAYIKEVVQPTILKNGKIVQKASIVKEYKTPKAEATPNTAKESELSVKSENLESEANTKAEPLKEFGTNYPEYYHKGKEAINKLLSEKSGQVAGAFHKDGLGDIDLIWGKITDKEKHEGYGLAHILDKRAAQTSEAEALELLQKMPEAIEKGKLITENNIKTILYNDGENTYRVGLSKGFNGKGENEWILTFYEVNKSQGSDFLPSSQSGKTAKSDGTNLHSNDLNNHNTNLNKNQANTNYENIDKNLKKKINQIRTKDDNETIEENRKEVLKAFKLVKTTMEKFKDLMSDSKRAIIYDALNDMIDKNLYLSKFYNFMTKLEEENSPKRFEKIHEFTRAIQATANLYNKLNSTIWNETYHYDILKKIYTTKGQFRIKTDEELERTRVKRLLSEQGLIDTISGQKLIKERKLLEKYRNGDSKPLRKFGTNYAEFYRDGKRAIEKLILEANEAKEAGNLDNFNAQIAGAFHKEGLGDIDLVWGDDNMGLKHILARRKEEFIKQGLSEKEAEKEAIKFVEKIPQIIENGEVDIQKTRAFIEDSESKSVIALNYNGQAKQWLLTAYDKDDALSSAYSHQAKHNASTSSKTRANGEVKANDSTNLNKNQVNLNDNINPSTLMANQHIGAGLVAGGVNGLETDENGNVSFNAEAFLKGLLAGSAGSFALSKGLKVINKHPKFKEALKEELKDTLAKGWQNATKQYPFLKLLDPINLHIMKSEAGKNAQASFVMNALEKKSLENAKKEAIKSLESIKGEAMPANLSEAEFLEKGFSKVINKENFLKHLKSQNDSQTRLNFLNLVEPTLNKWDLKLNLENGKKEYIKVFARENDKKLFYVLITEQGDKMLITGIPKSKMKSLKSDISKAQSIEISPAATQALAEMGTELKMLETHGGNSTINAKLLQEAERKFKFSEKKAKDLLEWHKDSSPLTKEADGLPKVFYHGSKMGNFEEFKDRFDKSKWGFWFSENKNYTDMFRDFNYINNSYKVFLNIKNPFDFFDENNKQYLKQILKGEYKEIKQYLKEMSLNPSIYNFINESTRNKYEQNAHKLKQILRNLGFDGIRYEKDVLIAFDSNQIKSVDNKGSFTHESGKITATKGKGQDESERQFFNENSANIYHSNQHIGAGLVAGGVNGLETDENGNVSFNAEAFLKGLLVGAGASLAFKKALEKPLIKKRVLAQVDKIKEDFYFLSEQKPVLFAKIMNKFKKNELLQGQNQVDLKAKEYFNKELSNLILEQIKSEKIGQMPKNAFKNMDDFKGGFDSVNNDGLGIIHTPYKDVSVDIKYAWKHFKFNTYNKNRDDIKGAFFETFKDPLFVVEQTRVGQKEPSVYFYKPFFDEKNQRLDLFGIGVDSKGNVSFRTFYQADNERRLINLLNDENLKIRYMKG